MARHRTKQIKIGNVRIGGNNPVAIQSMAKTRTSDVSATVSQINRLEIAGCEIVRVAVRDLQDAKAIKDIKKKIRIPLVADIHFNWQLAIKAIDSGADKIRLNPGNIYKREQLKSICSAAKQAGIPIRVGLNSGSVRGSGDVVKRMVNSALSYIRILESFKFRDIVVSLKASDAAETVAAYRRIAAVCDHPLHLGVTATGLPAEGAIKSSVAIGSLLLDGIGDTIRISLTDRPEEEVRIARCLLKSLGLRNFGPEIISCPTCGRCEVNLVSIVRILEDRLAALKLKPLSRPVKVAVMGCVVNGAGEAKQADIGIAFGKNEGLFFKKGKPVRKVAADKSAEILIKEIERFV
jgi:(E)-4-hydroxy-3-methylbut-2-enyl-diphosphate synthase